MHLKTLTLRGFKSFASATTLEFEPGVTCVVGPNGSGKSNVVDALAWVMGEQGAKTLRGGQMADVIFAGTSGRAPLGRAEVSLTIDNADGALPIDYTEVTISRTLFRSGGSEYAINGSPCRLLDIQDLLSDSGLGREMHVIVGQGQLDAVLRATPEDRRHFIEEAAGILKHRRRKEKALRKLDSMQANLTRVQDLTGEIRRQLGPLGKQAEVARQAQRIQIDVRDARSRLLADDLATLQGSMAKDQADESALLERRAAVEKALTEARGRLADLERASAEAAPALTRANDIYYRLSAQRERLRNLATLAEERVRMLGTQVDAAPPTDLVDLDEQLERARAARAELDAEVALAAQELEAAIEARKGAEDTAFASERHHANLLRSVADRREGVARLAGQVAAKRSRVESTEAEIGRLQEQRAAAERRAHEANAEFQHVETSVASVEAGEEDLDVQHESATEAWEQAKQRLSDLKDARHAAMRDRDSWAARGEALELSLVRKDGAGALLASGTRAVRGSLASLIDIAAGAEDAIAAALGGLADALAVDGVEDAVDAIRWLRDEDAGRSWFVVADAGAAVDNPAIDLPEGAAWASELVSGPGGVGATVRAFVSGVVVVEDLAAARALVGRHREIVAVTRRGDLLGARSASGGAGDAPSVLHMQAAFDDARERRDAAVAELETLETRLATAEREEAETRAGHERTLARLNESDARMAAVAEQLGQLGAQARAARNEADRLDVQLEQAHERMAADAQELESLAERLAGAQAEPEQFEADTAEALERRNEDEESAKAARARETEARLSLRTSEERGRALASRAESLERAVVAERDARARAAEAAARRERQSRAAREVIAGAEDALHLIDGSVQRADDARAAVEAERAERSGTLADVRRTVEELGGEHARLTDSAHRDEVARAEQKIRLEQLRQRAIDELGVDPDRLVEEFGPEVPVPSTEAAADDEEAPATPYVREQQEKRLRQAERAMNQLGRVNPLALEEFAALEERHKFLTDQLNDIKKSRADLLEIVKEIDARVEQVFAEAFADTAAQFDRVFPRLFPGGEGRLVLTDPGNMLETGIEVEARPAGKKVKRLSLLSGGERSLTAVALLVSIFKARPSPFYVMDEVEAALDDVNLGRLLEIFTELQEDSQLIVITHQKRTMEIADALYGVTMRGDGVTTVISQRLRDEV
ncbi:chromosome segregation protein SMC [Demequina sp. SYSU T00039]|uniref:Chromosome partition protein Smc n=1 Tax=Demequina lignilytica TaxID=3051663 RepID=A0AAW7M8W7_9MICO|nr:MULTISPECIES: chromosome segregation protein SMC [unclassified Demequina]MDN4477228.1 chromosome segregation protein SMC [Demequina sp. SYSU T00039-1]MDN4487401.1 chromosome segregation protein SMC [Demequina sp. SYSU T00039]MDN4491154.1 chromosome segregation protein SMC [Demequina sp. SYSU T00068]